MTPHETDPFSLVYDELWRMLRRSLAVTALVKEGNRTRFDDPRRIAPVKDVVSAADLPEVQLLVQGASGNLLATSSTSSCTRNYQWLVSTGDQRYSEKLGPIEWGLYAAMAGWRGALTALEWRGKKFVKHVNLVDAQAGLSDPEANRGIRGWSALWTVKVEMHFAAADLAAALNTEP